MKICKKESAYLHPGKPAPIAAPLFELAGAAVKPEKKPRACRPAIEIQSGSSIVKVFTGPQGKGPFTIAWREGAGAARKRLMRTEKGVALREAKAKADALANGELWRATMDEKNVATFKRSLELLFPTGKPMELACAEVAEAYRILMDAGLADSLPDAARFLVEHRAKNNCTPINCPEVLVKMLMARKRDGQFKNTLDDYRSRLGRFVKHFQGPVLNLVGKDINDWLRSLTKIDKKGNDLFPLEYISRRTRNNYRDSIREFCRFAKQENYLPKNWAEFENVERVKNEPILVKIYTPLEMKKLLQAARDNLVPFMAIGAFGKVRHEEMAPSDERLAKLDWRHINFQLKHIHVTKEVARKIGTDRIIPMTDNLIEWLKPHAKPSGPICELANASNALGRTAERAGVELIDNGLRKSALSYRLGIIKSWDQVAYEGGTSIERLKINYIKPVTEEDAEAYHSIYPPEPMLFELCQKTVRRSADHANIRRKI